jgi:hypothetical protein
VPKFLEKVDQGEIDSGRIKVVRLADEKPPEPPKPEDILRAISESISKLGELQASTLKVIETANRPDPDAGRSMAAVMARVVELNDLIRKGLESIARQMAGAPAPTVNVAAPVVHVERANWDALELTIHRDGYGRMNKVTVKREDK